jgi:hypothetical protein
MLSAEHTRKSVEETDNAPEMLRSGNGMLNAVLDLATGMCRGEILVLSDVDLDGATVRVERSLEETGAGLRFKGPKTQHGKRTHFSAAEAVAVLCEHRRKRLEIRTARGLGRPDSNHCYFGEPDGSATRPDQLRGSGGRRARRSSCCGSHSMRCATPHAPALIAAGLDVVVISRRLGHGSPHGTLQRLRPSVQARRHRRGQSHRSSNSENEKRTAGLVIGAFCGQSGDNSRFSGGSRRAKCLISLVRRLSSGVEQRFCKPLVAGSNPAAGTNDFNTLEAAANAALCSCGSFAGPRADSTPAILPTLASCRFAPSRAQQPR